MLQLVGKLMPGVSLPGGIRILFLISFYNRVCNEISTYMSFLRIDAVRLSQDKGIRSLLYGRVTFLEALNGAHYYRG